MSNLNAFLHPVQGDETQEIIVSKRFLGEDGRPVPFKIRALTQEENKQIGRKCMRPVKGGKRGERELDPDAYASRLIVAATVYPDFSSEELCKGYGTLDSVEVPEKMLYAGEYKRLMNAIMELSHFDEDLEGRGKKLMDGGDPDTLLAYYMFVNHGWRPQKVDELTDREKALLTYMAVKEIRDRPNPEKR